MPMRIKRSASKTSKQRSPYRFLSSLLRMRETNVMKAVIGAVLQLNRLESVEALQAATSARVVCRGCACGLCGALTQDRDSGITCLTWSGGTIADINVFSHEYITYWTASFHRGAGGVPNLDERACRPPAGLSPEQRDVTLPTRQRVKCTCHEHVVMHRLVLNVD